MFLLTVALTALLATNAAPTAPAAAVADTPTPALARAWDDIGLSLRHSVSPRDWALAAQIFVESGDEASLAAKRSSRAVLLRKAAAAAPKDRLVQWLWANASPESSGCNAADPCPDRAAALAKIEPENGAAWVPVVNAASQANDAAGVDAAFAHMAMAKRFDQAWADSVNAWADVFRRYRLPQNVVDTEAKVPKTDVDLDRWVMAVAISATTMAPYQRVINACNHAKSPQASAARLADCGRAGRLMLTHGDTQLALMFGRALLRVSATATAEDVAAARVVTWQQEQLQHAGSSFNKLPELRAYFADLKKTRSEVEARRLQLRRAGISLTPPVNWQPTRNGKPISPLGE